MDQRRFIAFLMISMAVWLLAIQLFPPPEPVEQPPVAGAPADGKEQPKGEAPADDAKKNGQAEAAKPQPPAEPGGLPAIAPTTQLAQYVAIGSLDPNSGYRMLVTLSNTGAAVVRAEMSSPRYRDQHDWTGYIGDLRLKTMPGGVLVQVVGAGTPAAKAELEPGDLIVGVGNPLTAEIKTVDELAAVLAETRPDQEITLQVRRGDGAPQPRTLQLARRPFAVVRPEVENYRMRGVDPPADFVDRPSFLLTLNELNGKALSDDDAKRLASVLETGNWELTAHDEKSAVFRRAVPELKLEIFKRYALETAPPEEGDNINVPSYHLHFDIELRNIDGADKKQVAYRLDGPTGMPLEGWWYNRKVSRHWGSSLRDVIVRFIGSAEQEIDNVDIVKEKAPLMGDGQTLAYAGVDSQYFAAVLIPQIAGINDVWFVTTEAVIVDTAPNKDTAMYANSTCRLSRKPIDLAAGATRTDPYQVFLGPKRPDLLSEYYPKSAQWEGDPKYSLKDFNYFGWFGPIARLMLVILHFFYGIVGNYGIAIILLTVFVRGLMFPISYRQTQNMARIQALKPEMDRINEKYKTDLQKKSEATRELYRKYNINPLGGCLPLLLQMPIFIGLWRALMVDVELRQSPLFGSGVRWCSNLAAPDMFLDWSAVMPRFINSGEGIFGLGPYLNILPIVTVVIMLITQKMAMPPPSNEQAAMQQKMMKYMMIFIGLMFYKVASGLCLYLIVSSLWGIAERKLLPKTLSAGATTPGGASGSAPSTDSKRPRGDGPNGSPRPKKPRKAKRRK